MVAACLEHAAIAYAVPIAVAEHVLASAAGGSASGIGPMRIDRRWLPILAQAGFAIAAIEEDDCANIAAGVWILAALGANSGRSASIPIPLQLGVTEGLSGPNRSCIEQAASRNNISPALLDAVLRTENGKSGKVTRNTNGSYDIGIAQINSTWLPKLARMGISETALLNDGCLNISVGAWILGNEMQGTSPSDPADFWRHVGNYNSHTPVFNQAYQIKVWQHIATK